eukprot:jgi/Mesvir1/3631/Mv04366-RA.3
MDIQGAGGGYSHSEPLPDQGESMSAHLMGGHVSSSAGVHSSHGGEDKRVNISEFDEEESQRAHGWDPAMDNLESLDYDLVENAVYRADQDHRGPWDDVQYALMKWMLAVLVALGTGLTAFFISVGVENFAGVKFGIVFYLMQYSYVLSFLVYVLFNCTLIASSALIVTQFAPMSAGSGIAEVKAYLNGVDPPGILLFRTYLGKVFGVIGSVSGGLALGKEGPMVHIGACIASLIGQGGSTRYRLPWKWLRVFRNDRERRDLVTCGAAAGVAAAFNTPVGGVLFALEEVTSWWRSQLLWRTFFTCAVVVVVVRALMHWKEEGEHGRTGSPIVFEISSGQEDFSTFELVPMAMVGVIGGILGAAFNEISKHLSVWRREVLYKKHKHMKVIEVVAIAALTTTCSFIVPLMASCTPCPKNLVEEGICPRPDRHYSNFVSFHCQYYQGEGYYYNDLATIFFNTNDDAIRNLFSSNTHHEFSAQSLTVFVVIYFILAVITSGTAVPAGLFVPSILFGAAYGRLVGMLVVTMYSKEEVDEGTYALLGAASFLAGMMRVTVCLCVILVEITGNLKMLPLIMLVLLVAKAVGDAFNHAIYEVHVWLKKYPLLESTPEPCFRELTALDMVTNKVVAFDRIERVSKLVATLRGCRHNGFPVFCRDENGATQQMGMILRSDVLVLLRSKADFQRTPIPGDMSGRRQFRYEVTDFVKPVSSHGRTIEDIALTDEELGMYLDLMPFMNSTPYLVSSDMSLTKVHSLFRGLGLRHLAVIPHPERVLGIITRKDILPTVVEHTLHQRHHSKSTIHNVAHAIRNRVGHDKHKGPYSEAAGSADDEEGGMRSQEQDDDSKSDY